jgi:circadian clock protein KaiC
LPVTSLLLNSNASTQRISTGISSLDAMLGSKGFYRGSSILVSGTAGTGKTSLAASFAHEVCRKGEKCIYFAFEESPRQIIRNMTSIGVNLSADIKKGLLEMHSSRPTLHGLEMHLVDIHKKIRQFKPTTVILDPITNLITIGSVSEVKSMLIRLIDYLQGNNITVLFTALSLNTVVSEQTDEGVSSLVDTWLQVRDIESNGERNRGLYIMKSRGMRHSNQVREFVITDKGLDLIDVYLGPEGILIGSAREAQQLTEITDAVMHTHGLNRKEIAIKRKRKVLEAQITSLREEFDAVQDELNKSYVEEELKKEISEKNRKQLVEKRLAKNMENGKSK